MFKKDNVYAKADEKFVKTTKVYADNDMKLYYDHDHKDPVKLAEIEDLFLKDAVLATESGMIRKFVVYDSGFMRTADAYYYTAIDNPIENFG